MKCLEINRINGSYPHSRASEKFKKYGVVILKEFLPSPVQSTIRTILESNLEIAHSQGRVMRIKEYPKAVFLLGDVLAVRELEPYNNIFFGAECVQMAKALLATEELVYWGDSSIQFGEAARGFHKDNVDRQDGTQDDWARDYELVRCGVYFQDHARHSGGLKVRLRSHTVANHLIGKIADIATQNGDMVIWSMRLTHSGNNKRLRFLGRIPLHPRLEEIIPSFLVTSEQNRRIAAFCSFGKAGSHVNRYIDWMNDREAVNKIYFQHARNRHEARALVSKQGVLFKLPNDYYGELDSTN
jgi:hypothetical protein